MALVDKDKAETIKDLLKDKYERIVVKKLPKGFKNDEIAETKRSFLETDGPFDGFGTIYGKGCQNAQRNYQYVFVSIIDDGTVAVVGKTSFWDTVRVNGSIDSSEKYNLGDLYRPYSTKNSNPTAKSIIAHYQDELISDVNKKITYAVIIPINNCKFDTEEYKGKALTKADKYTHGEEQNIGRILIEHKVDILNKNSHEKW